MTRQLITWKNLIFHKNKKLITLTTISIICSAEWLLATMTHHYHLFKLVYSCSWRTNGVHHCCKLCHRVNQKHFTLVWGQFSQPAIWLIVNTWRKTHEFTNPNGQANAKTTLSHFSNLLFRHPTIPNKNIWIRILNLIWLNTVEADLKLLLIHCFRSISEDRATRQEAVNTATLLESVSEVLTLTPHLKQYRSFQ